MKTPMQRPTYRNIVDNTSRVSLRAVGRCRQGFIAAAVQSLNAELE